MGRSRETMVVNLSILVGNIVYTCLHYLVDLNIYIYIYIYVHIYIQYYIYIERERSNKLMDANGGKLNQPT